MLGHVPAQKSFGGTLVSKQQASVGVHFASVTSQGGPVTTTPVELDEALLVDDVVLPVLVTDVEPEPPALPLLVAPGRPVPLDPDALLDDVAVENWKSG